MSPKKILVLFLFIIILISMAAAGMAYWKERRISFRIIKERFLRFPRFRIWLVIASAVFTGAFLLFYLKYENLRAGAVITLNYSEAHKGQNANGTRYNMNEIICDEVLARAIEMGAIKGISVRELQDCLSVEPLVEGNSEDEDAYHISTEFYLSYLGTQKLNVEASNIVQLVGNAYKEYCIENYADNFSELDISIDPGSDFESMDYLDIVDYLGTRISVIQNFMYGMANKSASFIASDGESFYSLAAKCENLITVQLQNDLRAYLLNNGISKNADDYIGRLRYDNNRMDFECRKALAGFRVRRDAIDLYAEEMTRIVLVPTWDVEGEYYMGRTKVGIDQLSVEAEEASKLAADYSKEMETNAAVISAYENTGAKGKDIHAEQMIAAISEEIEDIAQEAKRAGQEYSETRMNSCVSVAVYENSFLKLLILVAGMFLLFYLAADELLYQREA